MLALEAKDQGKLETMDNEDIPMLSNDNYHQWKEKMKSNLMNRDVWYLVCNGFTKIPPSDEEVQKNSKALSDIINNIINSTLNKVMHYATTKEVWDKLQTIHEEKPKKGCSSTELSSSLISNVSKYEHDDGVIDSEEDRLEEFFYLIRKLDLALKKISNLEDNLQAYDNRDHMKSVNVAVESKQYCEGLEAEIVSLKTDLEKSNKRNEELLQAFEEQENGLKE